MHRHSVYPYNPGRLHTYLFKVIQGQEKTAEVHCIRNEMRLDE